MLTPLSATLALPLWGRARLAELDPTFRDPRASTLLTALGVRASDIARDIGDYGAVAWGGRARAVDRIAAAWLQRHPEGTIVALGCGLDTPGDRLPARHLVHVDLPDVIAVRRTLLPDAPHEHSIAAHLLDPRWIPTAPSPTLITLAGVSMYLHPGELRALLRLLARRLPGSEIVLDVLSPTALALTNAAIRRSQQPDAPVVGSFSDVSAMRDDVPGLRVLSEVDPVADVPAGLSRRARLQVAFARATGFSRLLHLGLPA